MSIAQPPTVPALAQKPARAGRSGAAVILAVFYAATVLQLHLGNAAPPPPSSAAQLLLDPNTATADELALLPGLGPKLSQAIVAYRAGTEHKPAFRSLADLQQVRGIGPRICARIAPYLRLPTGQTSAGSPHRPEDESDVE